MGVVSGAQVQMSTKISEGEGALIRRPKAKTEWEPPLETPSSRTSGTHSLTRETPTSPLRPGEDGTPVSIERRSRLLRIDRISWQNVPPFGQVASFSDECGQVVRRDCFSTVTASDAGREETCLLQKRVVRMR